MDIIKFHPSGRTVFYYERDRSLKISDPKHVRDSKKFRKYEDALQDFLPEFRPQAERVLAKRLEIGALAPLGLSSIPKSREARKQRGSGGITSFGRRRVCDAATLVERSGPKGCIAFWTLTIPPGIEDKVHAHWPRIVSNLRNELRVILLAQGLPGEIVFCCEYQEARAKKHGTHSLHLHLLFKTKNSINRKFGLDRGTCDAIWQRTVSNAIGSAGDLADWSAASKIETVRSSAANYIGKYMSKGIAALSGGPDSLEVRYTPPSWYGITQNLLGRVMSSIKTLRGPEARKLISVLLANRVKCFKFGRWVSFTGDSGRAVWIAWYGDVMSRESVPWLWDVLESG